MPAIFTQRRAIWQRWMLGLIVAGSFLLSGCAEDCGWHLGATGVVVEPDRLVVWLESDGPLDGPSAHSLVSTDLGETWASVESEHGRIDGSEVPKASSWCGDDGCYEINGLALVSEASEGRVLWEPPAHRDEFIAKGTWGTRDWMCGGSSQKGPMTLHSIDGGVVDGREVVLVAAGLDGVLLRLDGGEVRRVAVGSLEPRPFTALGRSLWNTEMMVPIGMAGISLVLAALMIAGTYQQHPPSEDTGRVASRSRRGLLIVFLVFAVTLLAMWSEMPWPSAAVVPWLWALAITYRKRGETGDLPVALLVAAWALPAVIGLLPLLGWSVGIPSRHLVAMLVAWITSILAIGLAFLLVRSRLGSARV